MIAGGVFSSIKIVVYKSFAHWNIIFFLKERNIHIGIFLNKDVLVQKRFFNWETNSAVFSVIQHMSITSFLKLSTLILIQSSQPIKTKESNFSQWWNPYILYYSSSVESLFPVLMSSPFSFRVSLSCFILISFVS